MWSGYSLSRFRPVATSTMCLTTMSRCVSHVGHPPIAELIRAATMWFGDSLSRFRPVATSAMCLTRMRLASAGVTMCVPRGHPPIAELIREALRRCGPGTR